ncbi:dihydrodipicolinate synthase family protein [Pantoea sp. GD03673]|uniref:dihydrodipicolinate synthase family protein n=1 Tax=Pantoea sp. GD03673 TaxID=2975364 RepID=UPI0024487383|nr:dihydrodipicolinate synthase family protein [Pantoea sp. GD03673]MDH2065872.1 dihydrodipicolinate synthase family protein [Pantoea sp. GD03673]
MFSGLSAFPLTPFADGKPDEAAFLRLLHRLTEAKVDSLGVLGSTGSYAYLTRAQRKRIATLATEHAEAIPVMICVGAVSTDEVLALTEDAQQAGASALLLPPLGYQALKEDEVFTLFETVTRHASVPVCIYDNPGTTHFTFPDALLGRIAELPGIGAVKIPGVPAAQSAANDRLAQLRSTLPAAVSVGISGDASAANALIAGCDGWFSVCGGLFPRTAKAMTDAAAAGDFERVSAQSERLQPLWALFRQHGGSFRVISAAAGLLGLTGRDNLPRPLLPLSAVDCQQIADVLAALELA